MAEISQGEKWLDNAGCLWSIVRVDHLIEAVGPRGVVEFFNPKTKRTTSKFNPETRLLEKFVDEFAPKRKSNDQPT